MLKIIVKPFMITLKIILETDIHYNSHTLRALDEKVRFLSSSEYIL